MNPREVGKYFLHGLAYTTLMFLITLVLIPVLLILGSIFSVIGIVIFLAIWLVVAGWLNNYLSERLWKFPVKYSWQDSLVHGLALTIVVGIVSILAIQLPLLAFRDPSAVVILVTAGTFLQGFVGRRVAEWFEIEPPSGIEEKILRRLFARVRSDWRALGEISPEVNLSVKRTSELLSKLQAQGLVERKTRFSEELFRLNLRHQAVQAHCSQFEREDRKLLLYWNKRLQEPLEELQKWTTTTLRGSDAIVVTGPPTEGRMTLPQDTHLLLITQSDSDAERLLSESAMKFASNVETQFGIRLQPILVRRSEFVASLKARSGVT